MRQERTNDLFAEALYPLYGETAEQRALRHRRAKLHPTAQSECYTLDSQVLEQEAAERSAQKADRATVQDRLYQLRLRQKKLQC